MPHPNLSHAREQGIVCLGFLFQMTTPGETDRSGNVAEYTRDVLRVFRQHRKTVKASGCSIGVCGAGEFSRLRARLQPSQVRVPENTKYCATSIVIESIQMGEW